MMALTFVTLAVVSMLIFERKAFCQYFCPVGRTIGVYSELSMSTLRPIDNDVCSNCKTLECYHGNDQVEACPTHQVMGRMQQNSYCISCGQCVISCPHKNVNWALRSPETELAKGAREGTSESVFLLVILALTLFHGITMLPGWEALLNGVAAALNDSGRLLLSFSVLMLVCILVVLSVFIFASWVSAKLIFLKTNSLKNKSEFRKVSRKTFANLGFATLPVTFAYHVAHNLTHLFSESRGFGQVLMNPFGFGVTALSMGEKNMRHVPIINQSLIYMLQLGLIVLAFVIAIRVAHKRIRNVFSPQAGDKGIALSVIVPQTLYLLLISGFCLWLLAQPMSMRMSGM